MLLTSIPGKLILYCNWFTVKKCSAFFSIPVDEASQYLLAFTWEEKQLTWTVRFQGFTESPYFLQILKADLYDIKFPRGFILLQYVDDLLLCSPFQASSQEDNIHSLKLLALKGHKFTKEKLRFAQTQVQYLGHLIIEQRVHLDPDRTHCVLSFPKPKTKS